MFLIYRHLLASAAGPFFFGWFVITFVLMIDVLFRYVDLFVSKGVPFLLATKVLGLSLGYTFALSVPMAVLIAILMSVGQLATDHEITAMKACGISLVTVLRPLLFGAFVIGGLLTAYNHYVFPRSNHTLTNLLYDINRKKPMLKIRAHRFTQMNDRLTIYVGHKNDRTGEIEDVRIFEKEKPGDLSPRLTLAARGRIIPDHNTDSMLIELYDGETHDIPDQNHPERYQVVRFQRQNMRLVNMERDFRQSGRTARNDREMDLNDLRTAAASERSHQDQVGIRVRESSTSLLSKSLRVLNPDLRASVLGNAPPDSAGKNAFFGRLDRSVLSDIARLGDQARHQTHLLESYRAREARYNVEFHKKFAIPFACVVFALLGVPMAITSARSGKGISISLALAVYFIYYIFLMGGEKLADRGRLDPFTAMWSANIILLVLGIPLFVKKVCEVQSAGRPWWRASTSIAKSGAK